MGRYHYMPSHYCNSCKKHTHAIDKNHGYDLNSIEPNEIIWICAKCKIPFENIPKCGFWKGMYGDRSESIDWEEISEFQLYIETLQMQRCPYGYDFGAYSYYPECKDCRKIGSVKNFV